MNNNENEIQIDLVALFFNLRKKIWLICAVTAVAAVAALLMSLLLITPQFTASTRMYVLNRSNENNIVSSDFQMSNYMLKDYQELIKGRNVTSEVIKQLGLKMSDSALSQKITVTSPSDTRFLQITVEDPDPVLAAQIANAVRVVASEQLKKIVEVDAVNVVYEATVPEKASSPNVTKNVMLGAILGFVAVVGILSIIYIMDDRIRSEDDVERHLGLSTLGVIPNSDLLAPEKPAKKAPARAPATRRSSEK